MKESPLIYLPHRPPMLFIDEIQWVEEETRKLRCLFEIRDDFFLLEEGALPEVVLIEIMAQAAACLKGWIDTRRGIPVKTGYLVSIERAHFHDRIVAGDRLEVEVEMTEEISSYYRFNCRVAKGESPAADSVLGFMVP